MEITILKSAEELLTEENLLMIEWLEERTDLMEQFYLWLAVKEQEENDTE